MRYVALANTGIEVSAMCLGLGSFGTGVKGDAAERLLAAFIDAGGTFVDSAHCYSFWVEGGDGASERELGRCLRKLGCRDRVVIGTKGGHPDAGELYRRPSRYLAPEVISCDIDDSLSRLQVETIDLYYLHRDDTRVPVGEVMDALNREVERGRINRLGASNWSVERIAEANAYAVARGIRRFCASQVQWSLATPSWTPGPDPTTRYVTPPDAEWYAGASMPVIAYSATAGGYFSDPARGADLYDSPDNRTRAERARELAARLGATPTQIAFAYLLSQPQAVIPIFGTTREDHLREALGAVDIPLDSQQLVWLRDG